MIKKNIDFLVVGTAKAGTTSLFHYLQQHKNICLPTKETFFFISEVFKNINKEDPEARDKNDIVYDVDNFNQLMSQCNKDQIVGEIGTGYLFHHEIAIPNIKKYAGDPKIIIILRNPVDRAFSNYMHFIRNNTENKSFEEVISLEEQRKKNNWDFMWQITEIGLYAKQVEAYKNNFSNVKVVFYDDLKVDSGEVVKDIMRFLKVPISKINTDVNYNSSGKFKKNLVTKLILRPNKLKQLILPIWKLIVPGHISYRMKSYFRLKNFEIKNEMSAEIKEQLKSLYRDDIKRLEKITMTDLKHWQ